MNLHAWKTWDKPSEPTTVLAWQAHRCAMCGVDLSPCHACGQTVKGLKLVEDHCHRTGLRRGYLCRGCNNSEGTSASEAWQSWRRGDNPCAALGEFEVYSGGFGWDGLRLRQDAALYYYSDSEREDWWEGVVKDLASGEPWPTDAPWTATALARKAAA